MDIRRFLTSELGKLDSKVEFAASLRAMRAACRKFLDQVGVHPKNVSIVDSRPHSTEVGTEPNHGPTGAACRDVVGFPVACTQEPWAHSWDSQLAMELRNVETSHTDAS